MSNGFDVHPDGLDAVAREVRGAGTDLEKGEAALSPPQAGAVSGPIAAAMAVLVDSVGGVAKGLTVAGEAVRDSRAVYEHVDDQAATRLHRGPLSP